jgi:hypothetical protein
MRQVWAQTNVLFGIDEQGHPYLADYPLMISREDYAIGEYTDCGRLDGDSSEGIDNLEGGSHYLGNLTIFQDDESDQDTFRFSSVRKVALNHG